jgi:hypothetical protein
MRRRSGLPNNHLHLRALLHYNLNDSTDRLPCLHTILLLYANTSRYTEAHRMHQRGLTSSILITRKTRPPTASFGTDMLGYLPTITARKARLNKD